MTSTDRLFNHTMLQIINESLSLLLALIFGTLAYRYLDHFGKILFFQLLVWICFFVLSYIVTIYQEARGLEKNNLMVINPAFFVEITLLIAAGCVSIRSKITWNVVIAAFLIFTILFVFQIYTQGFRVFANYAHVVGSMILVCVYFLLLFNYFRTYASNWKNSPEIWMCMGILVYFTCNIPLMSLINYLNRHDMKESGFLFSCINDTLANARYLLLALSFWMIRRNSLLQNSKTK